MEKEVKNSNTLTDMVEVIIEHIVSQKEIENGDKSDSSFEDFVIAALAKEPKLITTGNKDGNTIGMLSVMFNLYKVYAYIVSHRLNALSKKNNFGDSMLSLIDASDNKAKFYEIFNDEILKVTRATYEKIVSAMENNKVTVTMLDQIEACRDVLYCKNEKGENLGIQAIKANNLEIANLAADNKDVALMQDNDGLNMAMHALIKYNECKFKLERARFTGDNIRNLYNAAVGYKLLAKKMLVNDAVRNQVSLDGRNIRSMAEAYKINDIVETIDTLDELQK